MVDHMSGRGRTVGIAVTALLLLSVAFVGYATLVTAQEDEAGENGVRAQQDTPPGCYREPSLGYIIQCPQGSLSGKKDITVGDAVTLTYRTTQASSVSITGIGGVKTGGEHTVVVRNLPHGDHTFTLLGNGITVARHTVSVHRKPEGGISADPTSICPGASSRLSWSTRYADDAKIAALQSASVAASGSATVRPTSDKTYTLSAKNKASWFDLGSVTISIRDDCSSPTPTSVPPPTPTPTSVPPPTPTPTAGPTPPPTDTVPSFGTTTIAHQLNHAGQPIATLQLPEASGGDGALSYSIAPAPGNGLTFNAAKRTISGTPTSATETVRYTYTATDANEDTAQISFNMTVFDVAVMVGDQRLEAVHWGVLHHDAATVRDVLDDDEPRDQGFQVRLGLPASTGFQFGQTCTGAVAAPTDTRILSSSWVRLGNDIDLARCALGSGAAVAVEVWVRLGTRQDTEIRLLSSELSILQSWHRDDHVVTYYIIGIDGSKIIGVGGLFPSPVPAHLKQDKTKDRPNSVLRDLATYAHAAKAWTDVSGVDATITPASSDAGADAIIAGYWDPGTDDDLCGRSIACTYPAGTYPHIGNEQRLLIEDPPRWPGGNEETWTTSLKDATDKSMNYEYLPRVLMHEFGHTLGLGHSADDDAIMRGANRSDLSDTDAQGLRATYAHHAKH